MKKIYTTLVAIVAFAQFSTAQWISTTPPYLYTTTNLVGIGTSTPTSLFSLAGNRTATAWGLTGVNFQTGAAIYTDSSTPASGIAINNMANTFGIPTLSATNTGVTYTNAATVYIAGPPVAGANTTITNRYALSAVGKISVSDEIVGAGIGSYGHSVIGLDVSEPDGSQYLLLVKKSGSAGSTSVAGTVTGKRNNNSGAGTNSASIYVNIRAMSGGNSQTYWEADAAGTSTPIRLVTLTYDNGDGPATWYAIDAVHTGASVATFGNASFDGHAGSAIFKWVNAGSVSNVAISNSDSFKNFGGEMVINTSGNVGIGTLAPIAPLDVSSAAGAVIRFTSKIAHSATGGAGMFGYSDPGYAVSNGDRLGYYLLGGATDSVHSLINTAGMLAYATEAWSNNAAGTSLAFNVTPTGTNARIEAMRILQNGWVGIGTKTPKEALSVNGNIRSKQVKVELTNWPDYVFKPKYNLPLLKDVKTYIEQNQHLPDMPTEAEVTKDGLNLGEVVKIQTKKLEELTLYLIEKDRQLNKLRAEMNGLKKQVTAIQKINKKK
jgi:uncharacterized coiled-coil protein SlyX